MLTEADKKWLRERRHENCETCKTHHLLCDRCSHIHPLNVWAWDRFTLSGLNVETTYDELRDAAEFEARVAAKLAHEPCPCFLPPLEKCAKIKGETIEDVTRCRLKHARLYVEEEMENE